MTIEELKDAIQWNIEHYKEEIQNLERVIREYQEIVDSEERRLEKLEKENE
jgi:hypothetical protein